MSKPPPANKDQAVAALKLFNLKYDRIIGYSFFSRPSTVSFRASSNLVTNKTTITTETPSEEQLDAVLLHLRFFQMRNEHSSFHHLPTAFALLSPTAETQKMFNDGFGRWMEWRELPSGIKSTSNREFLAIMLFGERVHRNEPSFYKIYDEWMENELISDLSMVFLCGKLDDMIRILWTIRQASENALKAMA